MALVVDTYPLGPYQANCYVVRSERGATDAAVVDPGDSPAQLRLELAGIGARCAGILVTHTDVDHIGGVAELAEGTGAEVWAPAGEVETMRDGVTRGGMRVKPHDPAHVVGGGDTIEVAGMTFEVVDVPGHSSGHIAFHTDGCLFSGDLLFAGSVGRVDLEGGDWDTLVASVRALLERYDEDTVVYPGHGPATTLGAELRRQPVPGGAARVTRIEAPRGTHDILPSDRPLWQTVTGEMERLCALYGYRRIQTPVFEDTELFARTSGAGSDIVQKEMYTFEDRSGRSLTLRPEGTAPICRAYIEHGMHRDPQPVKLYTLATMYRYSAPQRGRFREHTQLSLECIGSADPAIDAEVIQYYDTLLRSLGVKRFELLLNSIGDRACRPAYVEKLNEWLDAHGDVLDEDAKQKRATSPLRVFDVKDERVRAALEDAPKIGEALCDECRSTSHARVQLPRRVRRAVHARPVARARARLLHAHDVRVHRPGRQRAGVDHLRGRPLRLPGRGDRRAAHAGHRLRRGHRAPRPLARARGHRRGRAAPRRLLRRRARGIAVHGGLRAAPRRLLADSDHAGRSLKGQLTYGQKRARATVVVGADGWTLRRHGELDVPVAGVAELKELLA